MRADLAVQRLANVAAELEITRARLRGDMEVIFDIAGLAGLDAAINTERQRIAERNRWRLDREGYIG